MKILSLILTLFIQSATFCQDSSRQVIDQSTRIGIPYATVKILHSKLGLMADENGKFNLRISESDSVLISSAGYYEQLYPGSLIGRKITLTAKAQILPPVSLRSMKILRRLRLGDKEKFKDHTGGSFGTNSKSEYAQEIRLPNDSFSYRLMRVFVGIDREKCSYPVLLHICETDTLTGQPGEEIFSKYCSLTTADFRGRHKAIIDLSSGAVYLHNKKSFFIGIGWPPANSPQQCSSDLIIKRSREISNFYLRKLSNVNYAWGYVPDWRPFGVKTPFHGGIYLAVDCEEMR